MEQKTAALQNEQQSNQQTSSNPSGAPAKTDENTAPGSTVQEENEADTADGTQSQETNPDGTPKPTE